MAFFFYSVFWRVNLRTLYSHIFKNWFLKAEGQIWSQELINKESYMSVSNGNVAVLVQQFNQISITLYQYKQSHNFFRPSRQNKNQKQNQPTYQQINK